MRILIISVLASLSLTRSKDNPQLVCHEQVDVHAGLGDSITINCTFPPSEGNHIKKFCRRGKGTACKGIISSHKSNHTQLPRISLAVDTHRSVYTVNMSALTHNDTGTYWCVLENLEGEKDVKVACLKECRLFVLNSPKETVKIGENVRIKCDYKPSNNHNEEKYLCKGESPLKCKNITKETDQTKYDFTRGSGRQNYFPVLIKNATTYDAGTYWCFTNGTQAQPLSKITLAVEKSNKRRRGGRITASPEQRSSTQSSNTAEMETKIDKAAGVMVIVAVCLVTLALTVVALMLCKHCRKRGGISEEGKRAGINTEQENHGDQHYEEIPLEHCQANQGNPMTSVYTTVGFSKDQPHYASVRFQANPPADVSHQEPCGTNKDQPTNTQTVYSTIKKSEEACGCSTIKKSEEV